MGNAASLIEKNRDSAKITTVTSTRYYEISPPTAGPMPKPWTQTPFRMACGVAYVLMEGKVLEGVEVHCYNSCVDNKTLQEGASEKANAIWLDTFWEHLKIAVQPIFTPLGMSGMQTVEKKMAESHEFNLHVIQFDYTKAESLEDVEMAMMRAPDLVPLVEIFRKSARRPDLMRPCR